MRKVLAMLLLAAGPALAASPEVLLSSYAAGARGDDAKFKPSAERGAALYARRVGDVSCVSCHTPDARAAGKHVRTGKMIEPLAPSANPARFTDEAKAEKWFRRNCRDVFGRECSVAEKADFVRYLTELK
jgi:cytochrome c peroxidase